MGRPLPSDLFAPDSETRAVILGMPGPWAEDNLEPSDHYTTKVGGLPDWPMSAVEINSELLKCGLCEGELGLVAQVYAPLTIRGVEIDERTLYIFGCPSSSCGISPLSWRTLRVQGTSQSKVSTTGSSRETSSSDVASFGSRERGEGDGSDNQSHGNEWWDNDSWGPEVVERDGTDQEELFEMNVLETALLEAGYASAIPSLTQGRESDEEEIVLIDEDGTGESDDFSLPVLPCFYVYSQNESHPSRGSRAVSALEHSEHLEAAGRDSAMRDEETWQGADYEHDTALSADQTYLKFKKRLDCYPEQCFRYCFRGKPLWASKDGTDPGVCSHCGGPRVYEMQLMPPLLYYLQQACKDLPSTSYSPNDWEWLTLVVFSCAQSCTPPGSTHVDGKQWISVEEATILQYET